MLKIGLSACFMYPDPQRKVFAPKTLLYMGHDMSHYLGLGGVMPILIPDLPDDKIFYEFLDQLDGLLLQGGLDISPELYGETPMNFKMEGDPQRDMYELKILKHAVQREMPILGICRGMQLLNVFFEGSLHQDLSTDIVTHNNNDLYDENTHSIEFTQNGLFSTLFQNEKTMTVNSVHHQGVKRLGKNLIVEAISPRDKLVEAFTWAGPQGGDKPYKDGLVVGIQWHPEFAHTMQNKTICPQPLLRHFLNRCQQFQKQTKSR